jgi:hypothetical protein
MEEVALASLDVVLKRVGVRSFSLSRIMYSSSSRNATKGKVEPCEGDSGAGMLGGEELLRPAELSS